MPLSAGLRSCHPCSEADWGCWGQGNGVEEKGGDGEEGGAWGQSTVTRGWAGLWRGRVLPFLSLLLVPGGLLLGLACEGSELSGQAEEPYHALGFQWLVWAWAQRTSSLSPSSILTWMKYLHTVSQNLRLSRPQRATGHLVQSHHCPRVQTTQMFIRRWMDEHSVACSHDRIPLCYENK